MSDKATDTETQAPAKLLQLQRAVRLTAALLAGMLVALLFGGALRYAAYLHAPYSSPTTTPVFFEINRGESLRAVAKRLAEQHIISCSWCFVAEAWLHGQAHKVRAGEYAIAAGDLPSAVLERFVQGKIALHSFTVIEGWTFAQVVDALKKNTAVDMREAKLSAAELAQQWKVVGGNVEGWLLPETYAFPRQTPAHEVLQRAYLAMTSALPSRWASRQADLPLRSSYEALILASIVEKESALASERPLIAGVFIKRLRLKMPLQTDPTVIYGLGAAFDGNLTREHLRRDTPYNTYTRSGLPPTPIAMPSLAAIEAVLHPAATNAIYFVAKRDGTGGHYFSASLDEHNAAVRKYQKSGRH